MEEDTEEPSSSKGGERAFAKDDPILQRLAASNVIRGELYSSDDEFDLPIDKDELSDDLEEMFIWEQVRKAKRLFHDITGEKEEDDDLEEVIRGGKKGKEVQWGDMKESEILDGLRDVLEINTRMRDKLLILEQGLLKKRQELKDALTDFGEGSDSSEEELVEEDTEEVISTGNPLYAPPKDGIIFSEYTSSFLGQFAPPYFKTRRGFLCDRNSDATEEKDSNRPRVTDIPYSKSWTNYSLELLEGVLKKCLIEEFKSRPDFKSFYKLKQYTTYVKGHPLSEILKDKKDFKFDWMKVSTMLTEENRSPEECEKIWNLYLDPKLNKNPWTEDEDKLVVFLSDFNREFNWDEMAKEIGTGRTGFQVFVHYQQVLRKRKLFGTKWSPEEDSRLKYIIGFCTYGDYISWRKVLYYFENRTYPQAYSRYNNHILSVKKGKFSISEDKKVVSALIEHKLGMRDTARALNYRRSAHQIRNHAETVYGLLSSSKNIGEFTREEDELLLRLVEEKGPKWKEIAEELGSRNRTQVRHRYAKLKRRRLKDPSFDLDQLARKRVIARTLKRKNNRLLKLIKEKEGQAKVAKAKKMSWALKSVDPEEDSGDESDDRKSSAMQKKFEKYFLNNGCFKWFAEDGKAAPERDEMTLEFALFLNANPSPENLEIAPLDGHLKPVEGLLESFKTNPHLFDHPTSEGSSSNDTASLVPPNLLTCSGFLNLLSHCADGQTVNYPPVAGDRGLDFEEAELLWKRRLRQLFLMPAIFSNKKNRKNTY